MPVMLSKLDELERLLEQMLGSEIEEVSVVDHPATDRPWKLFKRAGAPAARRGNMPATKPDAGRLRALLGGLAKAVPEGRDRETFDRCVGEIMNRIEAGEIAPQDPSADPKSTAFAMCTESGVGKGAKQEPGEEPLPGEEPPPPPEESAAGETVEIPASPQKWPFSDCIAEAMELGFDQDSSIAVCQIIRKEYGDPEDPETLLVPDVSTTDSLLADAAVFGGIAKPEGMASPEPEQQMRFSGKNQWTAKFRRFLGLDRKAREDEAAKTRREVRKLMAEQKKTKDDLRETIGLLRDLVFGLMRANGVEIPQAALASIVPPGAATEPAKPEGDPAGEPAPEKRAATDPVAALVEEVARLRAVVEQGQKSADGDAGESPDASDARIVPNPRTAPNLTADDPAAVPGIRILRKSVDPTAPAAGQKSNGQKHYSTYLNAHYPQEDFDSVGPRR